MIVSMFDLLFANDITKTALSLNLLIPFKNLLFASSIFFKPPPYEPYGPRTDSGTMIIILAFLTIFPMFFLDIELISSAMGPPVSSSPGRSHIHPILVWQAFGAIVVDPFPLPIAVLMSLVFFGTR